MAFAVNKTSNEYADLIDSSLYEKMPKTVLAAIAVSFALRLAEDDFSQVQDLLVEEWDTLHTAGIVPQKPQKERARRVGEPDWDTRNFQERI